MKAWKASYQWNKRVLNLITIMKEVYYFDAVLVNSFAFLFPVFLINYFATGKFLLKRILGSYEPS